MRGPALALTFSLALAMAGASAASAQQVRAVVAEPQPARPAESGGRDSAATLGPLAIGSAVRDRDGALVGRLVLLTTDAHGVSVAKVRSDENVYLIPAADLFSRGDETLSTVGLADVQRQYAAP
jgi:hypothetical protein